LLLEAGAKELFVKDREGSEIKNTNYMLGARAEPSQNKNSYPMTDEYKFPSEVEILIEGKSLRKVKLEDDPADHQGILSWHYQAQNRKLDEAGSYGQMIKVPLSKAQINILKKKGSLKVTFKVNGVGGLAIYGEKFGRYPFDPSIVLIN
jgi:predicted transcriptional regulator